MVDSASMGSEDTIAAISTAPGTGAISVVRMSGPIALSIAEQIFVPSRAKSGQAWLKTHVASHGYVEDHTDRRRIDEVVVTPFVGPNSYTGEDLVEISCHGSPVVTKKILQLLIDLGARLAQPGEFTKRAFLSGRIDLTQAEAVLDLIQAKTSRQSRLALSALSGDLGKQILKIRSELVKLLTAVVAGIDFPEEVGETPEQDIEKVISNGIIDLTKLQQTARTGKFLRDGLRLAIVGKPNVGKSSLLNQLLRFERAIVTDIPGTTRDSLEEPLDINGIPVVLVDTAGIRSTDDQLELIGIERSKATIEVADLVLLVMDLANDWGQEEQTIVGMLGQKPWILVGNKLDLVASDANKRIGPRTDAVANLLISAKTGSGIDALCATIERWCLGENGMIIEAASLNDRQAELCIKAIKGLELVRETLSQGMPQDCLASDLKMTIDALSEICGEMVSEEVINEVFANFCIGK